MSGCDDRMSDDGRMSKWRFADSKMMAAQARARARVRMRARATTRPSRAVKHPVLLVRNAEGRKLPCTEASWLQHVLRERASAQGARRRRRVWHAGGFCACSAPQMHSLARPRAVCARSGSPPLLRTTHPRTRRLSHICQERMRGRSTRAGAQGAGTGSGSASGSVPEQHSLPRGLRTANPAALPVLAARGGG